MRRIVVVGGLAAGPAAAARAARLDPHAEVTLVEAGPDIAYGVCELPDLVAGAITDPGSLVPFRPQRFEREKRVRVLTGHRARTIDRQSRRLGLEDPRGREVELAYDALVLATGSRPRRPRDGAARPLKTMAEALALREAARRAPGGSAAILGAGYIGLLAAQALAGCGMAVTLYEREGLPLAGFEDEARRLVAGSLAAAGVAWQGTTEVKTGVVAGADVVVAALGAEPDVELARAAGIEIGASGGVRTDERGETSAASVFAAGDCAEVVQAVGGRRSPVFLATIANRAGRVAGANAAGASERLGPVVGALAFRAFGLEMGRVGLSSREAREQGLEVHLTTVRSPSRAPALGGHELVVSLVVERSTGRILGANVCGPEGAALRLNLLAPLVAIGTTAAALARAELAYAPFFSPLRDPLLVAADHADRERR